MCGRRRLLLFVVNSRHASHTCGLRWLKDVCVSVLLFVLVDSRAMPSLTTAGGRRVPVTLDNFENLNEPIDSPRSLKALQQCGYIAEDVYVKPEASFVDKKVEDAELRMNLAKVKFEHIEKKRRDKLKVVRAARNKLVEREERKKKQMMQSQQHGGDRPASAPETTTSPAAAATSPAMSPDSPVDHVRVLCAVLCVLHVCAVCECVNECESVCARLLCVTTALSAWRAKFSTVLIDCLVCA